MVSTDMATEKLGRPQKQFDVFVRLPTGMTSPVTVRYDMTIFELKSMIEFTFGVPLEMQKLWYRQHLLCNDDETLRMCIIIPGMNITVAYPYGWEELIEASLSGDTKSVINDIYHHFDKSIIARRRFIALFISSQKGFGFLVERMLSDGVNPNTQTKTGRTALHIASVTGMMNCVRLLLQHHASVDIRDLYGFTPQELADRSGQTEVEAKLIQFRHIKNKWDSKTVTRQLPWPLAKNFPRSKLAQSVTPVIELQRLCISPGPEEISMYPLPGQRPRSAFVKASPKVLLNPRCSPTVNVGIGLHGRNLIKHGNGDTVRHNSITKVKHIPKSAPTEIQSLTEKAPSENLTGLEKIDCGVVTFQAWSCAKETSTELSTTDLSDSELSKTTYRITGDLSLVEQEKEQSRIRKAVQPKFISEKDLFQMKYGKKRATDEENEQAFQQWLSLKQQDAKDEQLIRKVRKMLNQVTEVKVEETKESPKEESCLSVNEKAFESWLKKKKKAEIMKRQQENQRAKEYKHCQINRQGKTFEDWVKEKNTKLKSTIRKQEANMPTTHDVNRTEVFQHWLKKKQELELERLKARRPHSAASGFSNDNLPMRRRVRIQSAHPRLKTR
ncbi:uncharacterized protein [Antedon mediterranea]|uniref:uncharacterized protein n=1 Tax=Antedon mediterranea TaxID=105859 RepID=UPI003AF69EAD